MISDRKEQLRPLVNWHDDITVVPFSGVQLLDFGFSIDALTMRPARFIERPTGQGDEKGLIPLSGNDEKDAAIEEASTPEDDPYSIRPTAAMEPFLAKWVPVGVTHQVRKGCRRGRAL